MEYSELVKKCEIAAEALEKDGYSTVAAKFMEVVSVINE